MTSYSSSKRSMMTLSIFMAVLFFALVVIFIRTYAQNVPINDQALYSVPIAVQATEGDFSFSAMLIRNNGNRLLWSNLLTYAVAALTPWNILLESWSCLILAVLILIVLIKLAALDLQYGLPLIIILFCALVFSFNQQFNWIWAQHNSTYFFVLFFLLAVFVIRQKPVGWRPLILAALFCFCSLFSLQQGLISWPALVFILLARGYRNWKFYVFWLVASVLSFALFTTNTSVGATFYQAISIPTDLMQWLTFILALLGTPFAVDDINFAAFMGFFLLMVLAANVIYLGFYRKRWLFVGTWLSLAAFSVAIAVLISVGRLEMSGLRRAGSSWYITHSLAIWYAVIALSVESNHLIKRHYYARGRRMFRLTTIVGYLALIGFGVTYTVANYRSLTNTQGIFRKPFRTDGIGLDETCVLREPLTQAVCERYWTAWVSKTLLKYELAAFSQPTQLRLLPDEYKFGDTIVFDSQELDLHPFIDRIWFPDTLDTVFHLVPEQSLSNSQTRSEMTMTLQDTSKLLDISASQLWYISSNGNANQTEFSELIDEHYVYEGEMVDEQLLIVLYRHR